jgi:hypothetical protein
MAETSQRKTKDFQNLKIKVTSHCFDDIGKVLNQLNVKYLPFDGDFNCDILFLNCGTHDAINHPQLKSFVENGGILYASDLTSSHLISTWPELMTVTNNTSACKIRANIVDKDLRQYIGNTIEVEFDMGVWSKIVKTTQGKVLMQSADEGFPIMMEFEIGQGKVFYTSFHNHAQTSEMEKDLLQLLVIKQISVATDTDFQKTMDIMSLSKKPNGAVSMESTSKPQTSDSLNITEKWKTGNGDKIKTTETQSDCIVSKWRK